MLIAMEAAGSSSLRRVRRRVAALCRVCGGTTQELTPDAFIAGRHLEQAGLLPEPLRNRGWTLYAFHVPRRD